MLLCVTERAVGPLLTAAPVALFTVKLMLKLAVIPFSPLTVTVAVYGPPNASPCLGLTVNERFAFFAMLESVRAAVVPAGDTISKLLALAPDNVIVNIPVG